MKALIYLILLLFVGTNQAFAWESFYVLKPGELRFSRSNPQWSGQSIPGDCRGRIQEIICIVNPSQNPQEVRACLPGNENLAPAIEKIYDVIPAALQKAFCGLDVIFIENDMEALGYAGVIAQDPKGQTKGSFMGLRRSVVEQNYDATSVLGWKEQKSFGLKAPAFVHLPEGPRVDVNLPGSLTALHYIIVHEFAHILDFTNGANNFVCPAGETCNLDQWDPAEYAKLEPEIGSWSALSWQSPLKPRFDQEFPLWSKLCFYGCTEQLGIADMEDFYQQIAPTNFVTTYAAVSPHEDFAESLTFHVMHQQGEFQYQVQTPFAAYSLNKKWESLYDKKFWMQDFLSRDLKYPTPTK